MEEEEKQYNSPTKCIANLFSRQAGSEKQSQEVYSPTPTRQTQSLQNSIEKQPIAKGRLSMPN